MPAMPLLQLEPDNGASVNADSAAKKAPPLQQYEKDSNGVKAEESKEDSDGIARVLEFSSNNDIYSIEDECVPAAITPTNAAAPPATTTVTPTATPAVLPAAEYKKLSAELKQARSVVRDIKACWTLRSKALNRIEELARTNGVNGMAAWSEWSKELELLKPCLQEQLLDLRSSIVREACRCLIAMSDAAPTLFEDQLAFYLPILWKGLYVTIKVISSNCDDTCKALLNNVSSVKIVSVVSCNPPANVCAQCVSVMLLTIATVGTVHA